MEEDNKMLIHKSSINMLFHMLLQVVKLMFQRYKQHLIENLNLKQLHQYVDNIFLLLVNKKEVTIDMGSA